MTAEVYFASAAPVRRESLLEKTGRLFDRAGFKSIFAKGEYVALKLSFGEAGNTAYLRPPFVREIVKKVKAGGASPFLTDANTLYRGMRSNAIDHLQLAVEHGFNFASVDAPVIIADGLTGRDFVTAEVNLKHFKEIKFGSAVHQAHALIALTHFKGHQLTGFGGTFKNVGMGLGCRAGKQMMHADVRPTVSAEECTGCAECVPICPPQAILMEQEKAYIDKTLCIGCAECIPVCRFEAIKISWAGTSASVMEKMVEYTYGILQGKKEKAAFFNFLLDITPDCDCWEFSDAPIVNDIGILASHDPVAIDQASLDLVNPDKFRALYPEVDGSVQLKYAEELGLGTRKYRLIEI